MRKGTGSKNGTRKEILNEKRILFLVQVCVMLSAPLSHAQLYNGSPENSGSDDPPVPVDGGWQLFSWNGLGSFDMQGPFTFTSASSTLLTITDIAVDGDQFNLFDNGNLIGTTSVPANDGYRNELLTADACLADPKYSHGFFNLGAGSHSITIETIQLATGFSGGGAFFRVDTVPEPATLSLMAVAVGIFAIRRRR
jgi:hypothetical protein